MKIGIINSGARDRKRVVFMDNKSYPFMVIEYLFNLKTAQLLKVEKLASYSKAENCNLPDDLDLSMCMSEELIGKDISEITSLLIAVELIYRAI